MIFTRDQGKFGCGHTVINRESEEILQGGDIVDGVRAQGGYVSNGANMETTRGLGMAEGASVVMA